MYWNMSDGSFVTTMEGIWVLSGTIGTLLYTTEKGTWQAAVPCFHGSSGTYGISTSPEIGTSWEDAIWRYTDCSSFPSNSLTTSPFTRRRFTAGANPGCGRISTFTKRMME